MNIKDVGESLRQRRKYLKLTQQELSDLAEVNINTVVAVERGEGNPKVKTIEDMANVLGMELFVRIKD